uniref:ubiquitinyl hydrolase 1 n=4 Tax=Phytophthora fragariae TaxID=53985 RepID=A0A6A3ESM0_9STRA|nr:hypothetical protein PF009_g14649 [Phytophthora fragariae]
MEESYQNEVEMWEAHVQNEWSEIEEKKERADTLRADITRLTEELNSKSSGLAVEEIRLVVAYPLNQQICRRHSPLRSQLQYDIQRLTTTLQQTNTTLEQAIAMPRYLVRPLPLVKEEACKVLFMLTMPRALEILGNLCLSAQRAIAPVKPTVEMKQVPKLSGTTWQQFRSQHAPSRHFPADKVFTASPREFSLPSSFGPKSVEDVSSRAQYESECVWDLTLCGTALKWKDESGEAVNPFAATATSVVSSFIEEMSEPYSWMNAWPGGDDLRGNLVYANLHQLAACTAFDKASFIALGSLRAFPNQQYRKLLMALHNDVFPWSFGSVATIVRQSLYQVGDLTDETQPQILWKTDMNQDERGLKTFCSVLELTASRLEQTPRRFESVPLLSELAGYALQFTPNALPILKTFAGMARSWAENTQEGYEKESDPKRIAEARQKECILYGHALLAFTLGEWDDEAAREVCELIVSFRKAFLCASIDETATADMLRVESRVTEMMTRRIAELVSFLDKSEVDEVLTGLVRLVNGRCPPRLQWRKESKLTAGTGQFGSCFETVDARYAVNLFTGIVLTDGNPPGGLPTEILEHERFSELFGSRNFEVVSDGGALRTSRPYCNRFYDFALHTGGELFVQELAVDPTLRVSSTLQLCSVSWIDALGGHFPARLRELYSHWYWVERNCVLFRPKQAKCREIFFVATLDDSGALQCYQVPFSDTKDAYELILNRLGDYERFVQKDESLSDVLGVLAKFEDERFLHPLKSADGVMKFDDFLPRFSRYLVLELQDESDTSRPELRMLLPVGSVVDSSEGKVDVSIPPEADSLVAVVCYDVHRRLKTFETETIGARLQLAAVCVRSGTNVPSKRLQMTGSEAAVQMLRGCRSSQPFSAFERDVLEGICKLSYREPAVKILATALIASADSLSFLWDGKNKPVDRESNTSVMRSANEKSEYADMCASQLQRNPLRSQLLRSEEKLILGHVQHSRVVVPSRDKVSVDPLPGAADFVNSTELGLRRFLSVEPAAKSTVQLPIKSDEAQGMIKEMLDELPSSWDCHHSQDQVTLKETADSLIEQLTAMLSEVSSRRAAMETYVTKVVTTATSSTRDRLLALVNFVPLLTVSDVVRCAFDDETLHTLAPKLSERSRDQFKAAILQFMELCVLEDKVERLVWKAKRRAELSDSQLIEELMNVREWESSEFPYWLAFEVEGRLQIRHEQFVIARHLIESPGTVCQLNMGRGKTRVILPMLFLYFTQSRDPRVVRAHFLGPLLSEARAFMHRYLSASTASLVMLEQPFNRKICLDARRLEGIRDAIRELKTHGGIQIIAPEHRMSLELKRLEQSDDSIVEILDEILDNSQFVDVLDECDALLHHKYHMVYAVGTAIALENGIERWNAAEALLRVLTSTKPTSRVAKLLKTPLMACTVPDYASRLGAFDGTRLNTVVARTEPLREELKGALVLDLIDDAPFDFMWLSTLGVEMLEQSKRYGQWFSSVESGLGDEDKKTLSDVRHISLSDARQFATLCRVYKFCMETINFYLNTCVFPRDTQQYPQRLSRTAWNLAAGDSNIGFSGTNDNHRLFPLPVTQQEPDDPSLRKTNGEMIDKIVKVTQGYEVIRPSPEKSPIPWQSILLYAVDKGAQALIDTGALLAGVANHDAAQFLLQQPDFKFAGGTYYDTREAFNCWVIVEKHRRLVMPLKSASMQEKETFVIFDEARSRGSDMKLPHEASALLTLGPKLTKDKLMQGAGRMRQLGCNQTLWIASFDEVAQSVLQSSNKGETSELTAIDVLNWVIDNTKAESVRGLLEWASNGIHFRKTQLDGDAELVDEEWSLEALYETELKSVKISHAIEAKAQLNWLGLGGVNDELIARICERGLKYGLDDEVCVSLHTDECERELQVEEEVQQQQELELAQCCPAPEKTWNYAAVLQAKSVNDLEGVVAINDMENFIRKWIRPVEVADLAWSTARVFGT